MECRVQGRRVKDGRKQVLIYTKNGERIGWKNTQTGKFFEHEGIYYIIN